MYSCKFCGYQSESLDDFEEDFTHHKGYWCPYCDGFMTWNGDRQQTYRVIYETNANKEVSAARSPFPVRVSPLRYPGGKSLLTPYILKQLRTDHTKVFVEPYAGGASVGLALLLSGNIKELYLNDIDYDIYSLFWAIKNDPKRLKDRIRDFHPSKAAFESAQKAVKDGYQAMDQADAGWTRLIVNRLAYSGIWNANCMSNPAARWNPETLIRRIEAIHKKAEHIHISCMDALGYIEEMYWKPHATIFIDPPFYKKGNMLYQYYYNNQDHDQLIWLLDDLYKGMPGADILVTYDDAEYIKEQFQYPAEVTVGRRYSIAN